MIRKIYIGWVLDIAGREWKIRGQTRIRNTTWYTLTSGNDSRSLDREQLLTRLNDESIKYVSPSV